MKKFMLNIFLFLLIALIGCGADNDSVHVTTSDTIPVEFAGKTNPLGSDAVTAGAEVFKDYCSACHGDEGHGDGPAGAALDLSPKNLAELQTRVGDDYLLWRISTGKDGTAMLAWQGTLTETQIWQVISFIRTLK